MAKRPLSDILADPTVSSMTDAEYASWKKRKGFEDQAQARRDAAAQGSKPKPKPQTNFLGQLLGN